MRWLVYAMCALALTSCSALEKKENPEATAQVGIVNHTDKFIYSATVDGASGAGMSAWGAGIANICCTSIPRVWHPGMKVSVRWNMPDGIKDEIREKIVVVERYDRAGDIYIHFFPNDEVRVVVTNLDPAHPQHPIPRSRKPQSDVSGK